MSSVVPILVAIGGLFIGAPAGFWWGRRCSGSRARFWISAAVLFVVCVAVAIRASGAESRWLVGLALGVLTGGLTGLKYGWDAELRSLLTPRDR